MLRHTVTDTAEKQPQTEKWTATRRAQKREGDRRCCGHGTSCAGLERCVCQEGRGRVWGGGCTEKGNRRPVTKVDSRPGRPGRVVAPVVRAGPGRKGGDERGKSPHPMTTSSLFFLSRLSLSSSLSRWSLRRSLDSRSLGAEGGRPALPFPPRIGLFADSRGPTSPRPLLLLPRSFSPNADRVGETIPPAPAPAPGPDDDAADTP